jgi:hypothetical protein
MTVAPRSANRDEKGRMRVSTMRATVILKTGDAGDTGDKPKAPRERLHTGNYVMML